MADQQETNVLEKIRELCQTILTYTTEEQYDEFKAKLGFVAWNNLVNASELCLCSMLDKMRHLQPDGVPELAFGSDMYSRDRHMYTVLVGLFVEWLNNSWKYSEVDSDGYIMFTFPFARGVGGSDLHIYVKPSYDGSILLSDKGQTVSASANGSLSEKGHISSVVFLLGTHNLHLTNGNEIVCSTTLADFPLALSRFLYILIQVDCLLFYGR